MELQVVCLLLLIQLLQEQLRQNKPLQKYGNKYTFPNFSDDYSNDGHEAAYERFWNGWLSYWSGL